MPNLDTFRDVEELDNRYIGKCVVYVEGEDDRNVWERIAGGNFADRIEFKVPYSGGSGSDSVLNRVGMERKRNARIFGLVDGEVAARFGETSRLVACGSVLFELNSEHCDGILFLGAHELENVLVGESGLAGFLERNVDLRQLGTRNKGEIESDIARAAHRFFVAALIKYAWAELYSRGLASGIGDVSHFRSNRRLTQEIREAKHRIHKEFGDNDQELRREVVKIGRQVKRKMDSIRSAGGSTRSELVRLADGKGLLARLRSRWHFTSASDGLLVERVCSSAFGTRFCQELLAATNA